MASFPRRASMALGLNNKEPSPKADRSRKSLAGDEKPSLSPLALSAKLGDPDNDDDGIDLLSALTSRSTSHSDSIAAIGPPITPKAEGIRGDLIYDEDNSGLIAHASIEKLIPLLFQSISNSNFVMEFVSTYTYFMTEREFIEHVLSYVNSVFEDPDAVWQMKAVEGCDSSNRSSLVSSRGTSPTPVSHTNSSPMSAASHAKSKAGFMNKRSNSISNLLRHSQGGSASGSRKDRDTSSPSDQEQMSPTPPMSIPGSPQVVQKDLGIGANAVGFMGCMSGSASPGSDTGRRQSVQEIVASKKLLLVRLRHILNIWTFSSRATLYEDESLVEFYSEKLEVMNGWGTDARKYRDTLLRKLKTEVDKERLLRQSATDLSTKIKTLTQAEISPVENSLPKSTSNHGDGEDSVASSGKVLRLRSTSTMNLRRGSMMSSGVQANAGRLSIVPSMAGQGLIVYSDLESLAKQLSYLEYEIFSRINMKEMFHKAFEKRDKSPYLSGSIDRTNAVTAWVMTDILRTRDLRTRSIAISRWIDLASQLRSINNFAGVIEIVMALQNSCISRMKLTWRDVPTKQMETFHEMCELANPENNYAHYRNVLKDAPVPLLPYLACFLRDLTYLEEMPNHVVNTDGKKIVNWSKMRQLGGIFQFLLKAQEFPYSIEPNWALIPLLRDVQVVDEKTAYAISKELEPSSVIEAALKKKSGDVRKKVDVTECPQCTKGIAIANATYRALETVSTGIEAVSESYFSDSINLHYWLRTPDMSEDGDGPQWTSVRRWELDTDIQHFVDLDVGLNTTKEKIQREEEKAASFSEKREKLASQLLRCCDDVNATLCVIEEVMKMPATDGTEKLLAFLRAQLASTSVRLDELRESFRAYQPEVPAAQVGRLESYSSLPAPLVMPSPRGSKAV